MSSYNNDLLSRQMFGNRTFNNFDTPEASSTIHDNDLLDLDDMTSPQLEPYSSSGMDFSASHPPPVQQQQGTPVQQPFGFQRVNNPSNFYGTTPPVPDSSSPFDDFMLTRMLNNQQQPQPQHRVGTPQRSGSLTGTNGGRSQKSYIATPQQLMQQTSAAGASGSGQPLSVGSAGRPNYAQHQLANQTPSSYGMVSVGLASSPVASTPGRDSPKSPSGRMTRAGLTPEQQKDALAERRRKRKESHNAVERRRRDNINERIHELATLVPESFGENTDQYATKDNKPNKGTILTKSVDYIKFLQSLIDAQNNKEIELQETITRLQQKHNEPVTVFEATTAELMLQKIGAGPLVYDDDNGSKSPVSEAKRSSIVDVASPSSNEDLYTDYGRLDDLQDLDELGQKDDYY